VNVGSHSSKLNLGSTDMVDASKQARGRGWAVDATRI
jgi:hypothetical protein